jgi:hypothetical protein
MSYHLAFAPVQPVPIHGLIRARGGHSPNKAAGSRLRERYLHVVRELYDGSVAPPRQICCR